MTFRSIDGILILNGSFRGRKVAHQSFKCFNKLKVQGFFFKIYELALRLLMQACLTWFSFVLGFQKTWFLLGFMILEAVRIHFEPEIFIILQNIIIFSWSLCVIKELLLVSTIFLYIFLNLFFNIFVGNIRELFLHSILYRPVGHILDDILFFISCVMLKIMFIRHLFDKCLSIIWFQINLLMTVFLIGRRGLDQMRLNTLQDEQNAYHQAEQHRGIITYDYNS